VGPNHLLNMLLTNLGKMEYPSYSIVKTTNIFRTREDVILYVNFFIHKLNKI